MVGRRVLACLLLAGVVGAASPAQGAAHSDLESIATVSVVVAGSLCALDLVMLTRAIVSRTSASFGWELLGVSAGVVGLGAGMVLVTQEEPEWAVAVVSIGGVLLGEAIWSATLPNAAAPAGFGVVPLIDRERTGLALVGRF